MGGHAPGDGEIILLTYTPPTKPHRMAGYVSLRCCFGPKAGMRCCWRNATIAS